MLINRAMDPVNYARDPGAFTWRRDELNVVLAFSGFYVREDGKVAHADKATTLDAARARAGRLKSALESRGVHTEVLNYCRAELLDENYFHAVFESTKGVAERIRLMSGLTIDGAELVNKAFSIQSPILVLVPLATESEKGEQKGFANLLVGLFGAVRNPLAHAPKTNWPMSEQDALDILTLRRQRSRDVGLTSGAHGVETRSALLAAQGGQLRHVGRLPQIATEDRDVDVFGKPGD